MDHSRHKIWYKFCCTFCTILFLSSSNLILRFQFTSAQEIILNPPENNIIKLINESHFVLCESPWFKNETLYWTNPQDTRIQRLSSSSTVIRHHQGHNSNRIHVESSGEGLGLHLKHVQLTDIGLYTCYVTDQATAQSYFTRFNLTVLRPIRFNSSESIQTAIEGEDFNMKCNPLPQNGKKPKTFWNVNYASPERPKYRMLGDGSLLITNVTKEDAADVYLCIAINTDSTQPQLKSDSRQMKIQLIVEPPDAKSEVWSVEGEWTTLTCRIDNIIGATPIQFAWFYHGQLLQPTVNTTSAQESSLASAYAVDNPSPTVSNLHVYVKDESSYGEYICTATTTANETYRRIRVLKKATKPNPPKLELVKAGLEGVIIRDLTAAAQAETSLAATPEAIMAIDRYEVRSKVATSAKSLWMEHQVVTNTTDNGLIVLTGFLPEVKYVIQVAAFTMASKSNWSEPLEFIVTSNNTNDIFSTTVSPEPPPPTDWLDPVETGENITFVCKPRKGFSVSWFRMVAVASDVRPSSAVSSTALEPLFKDDVYYSEDVRYEFDEEFMYIRNVSVLDTATFVCETTDPELPTKHFKVNVTSTETEKLGKMYEKTYGQAGTSEDGNMDLTHANQSQGGRSWRSGEIIDSVGVEAGPPIGIIDSDDTIGLKPATGREIEISPGPAGCKCGNSEETQLRVNILQVQMETERLKQRKLEREMEILENKFKLEMQILRNSTKCTK